MVCVNCLLGLFCSGWRHWRSPEWGETTSWYGLGWS